MQQKLLQPKRIVQWHRFRHQPFDGFKINFSNRLTQLSDVSDDLFHRIIRITELSDSPTYSIQLTIRFTKLFDSPRKMIANKFWNAPLVSWFSITFFFPGCTTRKTNSDTNYACNGCEDTEFHHDRRVFAISCCTWWNITPVNICQCQKLWKPHWEGSHCEGNADES